MNGKQIKEAVIEDECRILFGVGGQICGSTSTNCLTRSLPANSGRSSGHRAMSPCRCIGSSTSGFSVAFSDFMSKRYVRIIGVLVVFGALAAWFGYQKQSELNETRELAQSVFYRMKTFELTLSQLQEDVRDSVSATADRRTAGRAAAVER